MYGTVYGKAVDVPSLEVEHFTTLLKQIPDEVIRQDWKQRYQIIREKFPRNYIARRQSECPDCHKPFGARQMREHKCPKKKCPSKI